jgi:UDP-glucose:(glucosyl)LPS alpha-1,2-glucosyltransferase
MELIITGLDNTPNPAVVARGGTELMRDRVLAMVPADLQQQVQLVISAPPAIFEDKPRILWIHDLPGQPGPHAALVNDGHKNYNVIVFVSHWQREQFLGAYEGLPPEKCLVIKNGIEPIFRKEELEQIPTIKQRAADAPFKLVYSSTPHRGLEVVPYIADGLVQAGFTNFEYHIYSSFALYGQPEADIKYTQLYERLRQHPNVRYHGTVSNAELRESLKTAHMWVYPCVYHETSCLAAIEAMAAGCILICPGMAALPETCGEWAFMYPFVLQHLAHRSINFVQQIAANYDALKMHQILQAIYANDFYRIDRRRIAWTEMFQAVVTEGIPTPDAV